MRSGYQSALEDWNARGAEWDAQVATTESEDAYNTDEAKAARMREAGLNPDLLGTQGASEAAEFTEPESPDVNAPGDSEDKIFAAIGNVGKIMAWATSMTGDIFKNLGLWEEIKTKITESGDLTMSQYEELKNMIKSLSVIVERLEASTEKVYNYTMEIPDWGRPTIQKLLDKGLYKGSSESDLNLPESLLRTLVINDRAGLYD